MNVFIVRLLAALLATSFALLPAAESISLASFGARGDGITDDAAAWMAAFAHCSKYPGTSLMVPAGRYRIAGEGIAVRHERYHLAATGLDGVSIIGEGDARMEFAHPEMGGIHWKACRNTMISGITFDWDPAPWMTTTIRTMGSGWIDVEPTLGGPASTTNLFNPTGPDLLLGFMLTEDRSSLFSAPLPNNHRDPVTIEAHGNGLLRMQMFTGQSMEGMREGMGYLLLRRSRVNPALTWLACTNSSLFAITLLSSPSIGIRLDPGCSGMRISGCRIVPRPGTPLSTNADGIMVIGNRSGPRIEGCDLEGVMDEGISIYTYGRMVRGISVDGEVLVERYYGADLAVGDAVEVLTADRRRVISGMRVNHAAGPAEVDVGGRPRACERLAFATSQAVVQTGDLIFAADAVNQGLRIVGNRITRIRGKGIKISGARAALVAGNHIQDTSGAGIELGLHLAEHTNKFEAMRWVDEIEVSGNEVIRSGLYGLPFSSTDTTRKGQCPAIRVDVSMAEGGPGAGINREILISGNRVDQCAQTGIQVDNTSGVTVGGNIVTDWNRYRHTDEAALHLRGCSRVILMGNRLDERPGPGLRVIPP